MGLDKKEEVLKNCGNILINIKANKKSKVFIYNCAFCDVNCDQLKKFSLHLDEKHSENLSEDVHQDAEKKQELEQNENMEDFDILEPQIKVEELMEIENPAEDEFFETNPLETNAATATVLQVKLEHIAPETDEECGDADENTYNLNLTGLDYEDSVDGSESEAEECSNKESCSIKEKLSNWRKRKTKTLLQGYKSNASSDDSRDSDFDIEAETKKHYARKAKKQIKQIKKDDELNVDEKQLVITILQALEKQTELWEVKDRSNDKAIRQAGFQSIAKEVNKKLKINIKWENVRKRIKCIRDEYSREYDKQLKGEKCKMPWYTEHMKFLEENIKYLIKHRCQKKKYRRLKTLDESHIPFYIEYYKNCEILWQINNIAFVVKIKKMDALKQIVEDIKAKQNIDISVQDVQRRLDYINRIYSADKEKELKCQLEKTEFVPSSKFYAELSFLSDSQGPFKCSHCDEIIYKFETYHQHVANHTNSVPFKCALCEMRFNKLHKYIVHAKRHLGINNYHCDVCGKGYPFRAELEWHVREHTGEAPYLCEYCGASFRARHGYDNHIRRHENRFRYECHICKYGFNHLHALNAHVKAHLNIRDILCNVCGKGFTAKKHLARHQQIHSGIKRYICGVCGKAFAQDAGLRAHRKQHIENTSVSENGKKRNNRKINYKYD